MAIVTPGSLLQLGGNVPAQFERLRSSHLTRSWPSSATNGATRLDGQGGVWPQVNALNVTATGTPDMNVHVDRGSGITPGTENVAQGNYPFFNDASVTVAIAAANTQARIDSIVAHVKDAFYSGVSNLGEFLPIAGTPGSGSPPNLSSLDKNYLEIARIAVGANVTSINTGNITNLQHLLPAGLDVPNSAELSNPGSFNGHPRINTTSGEFEWWSTTLTAWRGQQWVAYTPTWTGFTANGTGPTAGGRYFKTGTRILVQAWVQAGATGTVTIGTGHITVSLPISAVNANANDFWVGHSLFRTGIGSVETIMNCAIGPSGTASEVLAINNSNNNLITPGNGGIAWTNGSIFNVNVEYESSS